MLSVLFLNIVPVLWYQCRPPDCGNITQSWTTAVQVKERSRGWGVLVGILLKPEAQFTLGPKTGPLSVAIGLFLAPEWGHFLCTYQFAKKRETVCFGFAKSQNVWPGICLTSSPRNATLTWSVSAKIRRQSNITVYGFVTAAACKQVVSKRNQTGCLLNQEIVANPSVRWSSNPEMSSAIVIS